MVVLVPSTCTDQLQPLYLSVNKPSKDFLKRKFAQWYSKKVTVQISSGKRPDEILVDMKLTIMKDVGASWLVSMYDYIRNNPQICING